MEEIILTPSILKTTAEYRDAFAQLLEAVTQIEEKMQYDRVVIERLKVETRILKAESDLIKARTLERLDTLMAVG